MDPELHRVHADVDESHWWFVGRRKVIEAVLRRHVGDRRVVVDLGCGSGGLLRTLSAIGAVTAVEADAGAVARARRRNPDVTVRIGELPAALQTLPSADLITAFDVIEHLDDDVGMMWSVREHLRPGGLICLTVPALPWLWSAHDVANGHRRRYTARHLERTLQDAGLEIVHLSYFNAVLFPLVAVARLMERFRGPNASGDFSRGAGRMAIVLEKIFSAERFVVPRVRVPIGVSLIVVARSLP